MREIRPSGSEGGGIETNRHSLPLFDCKGTEPDNRDGRDESAFTRVFDALWPATTGFSARLSSTPWKAAGILAQPLRSTRPTPYRKRSRFCDKFIPAMQLRRMASVR